MFLKRNRLETSRVKEIEIGEDSGTDGEVSERLTLIRFAGLVGE